MFHKRIIGGLVCGMLGATVQISYSMAVSLDQLRPYSGQINSYCAAGVLPYAKASNGKTYLLLGYAHAGASSGYWAQFGGGKEVQDQNKPLYTAAREGAEELTFIFDNDQNFEKLLDAKNKYGKYFDIHKAGSTTYQTFLNIAQMYERTARSYPLFFPRIAYDATLPHIFQQRTSKYHNRLPHTWNETTRIAWVSLDDFLSALDSAYKNHPNSGEYHVKVVAGGYTLHIWSGLAKKFAKYSVRQSLKNI